MTKTREELLALSRELTGHGNVCMNRLSQAGGAAISQLIAELDTLKANSIDTARESILEEAAEICEKREAVLAQHLPPGVAADYFVRGAESASRRNAQHIRAAMSAQQGDSK
jgi:hypothetical protein